MVIEKLPQSPLIKEVYGNEPYEYYPLGQYIVVAPGVCGGRPTFKYTRLEVSMVLALIRTGRTIEEIIEAYEHSHLTQQAIQEAIQLAEQALVESAYDRYPIAA